MTFEAQLYNAWVQGGAKTIKQEAPQRLKKEGWESVRFALSITIRYVNHEATPQSAL